MAALLLPLTTRFWPISLRRFGVQRTITIYSRWHLPKSRCSAVESRSGSRRRQAEITITGCSIWCREFFCSNTQPKIFPTTTRSCSSGSRANYEREILAALGVPPEKIRYVDSRERFQIASAVFPSMDINVIAPWKAHGLRDLPFSGKQISIAAFIFRGQAPQFAGSRMKTKSQRSCGIGISEIVEAENLSWPEQANLFAGASVIVAPHGVRWPTSCFANRERAWWRFSTRAGYRDGIGSSPQLPGSPTK